MVKNHCSRKKESKRFVRGSVRRYSLMDLNVTEGQLGYGWVSEVGELYVKDIHGGEMQEKGSPPKCSIGFPSPGYNSTSHPPH